MRTSKRKCSILYAVSVSTACHIKVTFYRWPVNFRFAYDGTKINSKVSIDKQLDQSATGQQAIQLSSILLRGTESHDHYFPLYRKDKQRARLDDESTKRMTNKNVIELLNNFAYLCIYRVIQNDDKNAQSKTTFTAVKQGALSVSEDGARVAKITAAATTDLFKFSLHGFD